MTAELYRRWLDELWNGEPAGLDRVAAELVTDDFVGNWPQRPGLVHAAKELADMIRRGHSTFTGLRWSVELGPLVDGDLVAARWVAQGGYEGRLREFRDHDILRVAKWPKDDAWVRPFCASTVTPSISMDTLRGQGW